MTLKGKNAVITGASRGLGKAIATEFVKQGANVLICARDTNRLMEVRAELREYGTDVFILRADVSDKRKLDRIYNVAVDYFGKVDILVNNAGIQGAKGLIEDTDWDEWTRTIQTNLMSVVYLCRLFIPHFRKNGSGKIINISGGGAANPRPYFSAYATSKAGVVRFSETIAEELRGSGVYVNCVAPGALNTSMLEEVLNAGEKKVGKEYYKKALLQKKMGGSSVENAAELVAFLGSDKSDEITGKLVSAIWDEWRWRLTAGVDEIKESDIYTLRRILP